MRKSATWWMKAFENVPKVAFYTNAYSLNIIRKLYDLYYKPGKFKNPGITLMENP